MEILDIIIILVIVFIVYKLLYNNKETYQNDTMDKVINDISNDMSDEYYENPEKYINQILKKKRKVKVNQHFIEHQYNQDYRDTSYAFSLLIPNEKQLFNKTELPILKSEKPSLKEISKLVVSFIKELNKTIKNKVPDNLNLTGWNVNHYESHYKDGFEDGQANLGLPKSIYVNPAPRSSVRLIKVDHAEKYETDDEIRYVLFLIIKKKNVSDQMVIKVSFVVNKKDFVSDRDMIINMKQKYDTVIRIEDISVIGFMTTHDFGNKSSRESKYDYDNITDGRMFSSEQIIKELNKKKENLMKERCSI